MSVEPLIPKCRYCSEEAHAILEGWRHGPPERDDTDNDRSPDEAIPVCQLHRSTGALKLASLGYPRPIEREVGTIFPSGGTRW